MNCTPHFFGGGGRHTGLESKMLYSGTAKAYRSWQSQQQKFVAIGYLWLIQQASIFVSHKIFRVTV